ncbi:hypothetical protein M8976_04075 [Pasteurella multocida]|uniref:hypothetical protein n=1 Tax=Pasteurella multocida TaxID=747 RepID=UPI0020205A7D|nr:hypothetical protein [Pasteurella multocida]MCL7832906.1 hypothetical protein [Pasteurella multocida]
MNEEIIKARDQALAQARKQLNISNYRVERFFDRMPQDEKEIIFALAQIDQMDQVNPGKKPKYLRDFTREGIRKIAKAYQKIRKISNRLPQCISINEFYLIDEEVNYANRNY